MKRVLFRIVIAALLIALAAGLYLRGVGGRVAQPGADFAEGDYVGYIAPQSSPVTDGESARSAAAQIFGVKEGQLSVTLEDASARDTGECCYKLQQMSGDLPVWGRRVNLSVAGESVYLATGNLSETGRVKAVPEISRDEALSGLSDYVRGTLLSGQAVEDFSLSLSLFDEGSLCVYDQGEYVGNPRLAYDCAFSYSGYLHGEPVGGSYDVLIDARTARVLHAADNVYTARVGLNYEVSGLRFYAELEQQGDEYIFRDDWRNMRLYNAEDCEDSVMANEMENLVFREGVQADAATKDDVVGMSWYGKDGELIQIHTIPADSDNLWDRTPDGRAFKLFSHAQATYDFYWQVLGRKGFNNGNGQMNLAINHRYEKNLAYSRTCGNATLIAVEWVEGQFNLSGLDEQSLIAHEFTHSVEHSISCMTYAGESGAIMEGYSDTFGVLAQAYTQGEEPTWVCAGRDMTTSIPYESGDYMHANANMLSNRAYLIWQDWTQEGIGLWDKIDDMAHLFYRALFLLQQDASYTQWYWATEQIAQYMLDYGELTQAQYEAVLRHLGQERQENEQIPDQFQLLKTAAVLLAQEYERSGEYRLTDALRERASISLIPGIAAEVNETMAVLPTNVRLSDAYDQLEVKRGAMLYYCAALFGEEYASRFSGDSCYTRTEEVYQAPYRSPGEVCSGWRWEITLVEELDDINTGYRATLTSPQGAQYRIRLLLSQDEGGYTGAFFNGYYLCDMGIEIDRTYEILTDWLAYLVRECGVIEVGTEEYAAGLGDYTEPYENVVPRSRIYGLLAAEIDDYDSDGSPELLTVRVEPDDYPQGAAQGPVTAYVTLEICDVRDNQEVICNDMIFPVLNLPQTLYPTSFHLFKTTGEQGVKLYFDHYFSFNSQTFAVLQMEYADGALRLTDGAELDEYAYSIGCYRAVSREASRTILGRQDYEQGQDGWEEYASAYWDYGFTDEQFLTAVTGATEGYSALLRGMGLTDTLTRAMCLPAIEDSFDRCTLRPAEHYACEDGPVQGICSIMTPYAQSAVILTVADDTSLLTPYRAGNAPSQASSAPEAVPAAPLAEQKGAPVTASGANCTSAEEVYIAFAEALREGTSALNALYSERQLAYLAERGDNLETVQEELAAFWQDITLGGSYPLELTADEALDIQRIFEKFGSNSARPDEAARLTIIVHGEQPTELQLYAIAYEDAWYLSCLNN